MNPSVELKSKNGITTTLSTNARPGSILHEVLKTASERPEIMGGKGATSQASPALAVEMVNDALSRSEIFIGESLKDLDEKVDKQFQKLLKYEDEEKRAEEVLKIKEKISKLNEEREVIENLASFASTARERFQSVQLTFSFVERGK